MLTLILKKFRSRLALVTIIAVVVGCVASSRPATCVRTDLENGSDGSPCRSRLVDNSHE
jgi:hypothetical protein